LRKALLDLSSSNIESEEFNKYSSKKLVICFTTLDMIEKYLCFDIGFVKPGVVLILKNIEDESLNIEVFENIKFITNTDSISILEYFFSQKIDLVILEQQMTLRNTSLMQFIHGYCLGKGISVIIKRPISYLREKEEKVIRRSDKKAFSVNYVNNILKKNNMEKRYLIKESDVCDAINIGLSYIYGITKKNMYNIDIKIKKISHHRLHFDHY
jgi:hypothetical protein